MFHILFLCLNWTYSSSFIDMVFGAILAIRFTWIPNLNCQILQIFWKQPFATIFVEIYKSQITINTSKRQKCKLTFALIWRDEICRRCRFLMTFRRWKCQKYFDILSLKTAANCARWIFLFWGKMAEKNRRFLTWVFEPIFDSFIFSLKLKNAPLFCDETHHCDSTKQENLLFLCPLSRCWIQTSHTGSQ